MISNKKTRFYRFMRAVIYLTTRLFYKKVVVKYVEPLPKDKPIIFVGNHLSTFLDPILISVNTGLYPAFLTKADVFKNPLVCRFLFALRMLPIYRQRDGADFVQKNEAVFDTSIQQLEANLQFVIFGEGSHSSFRRLRELKKGFARIGFEALERHNGALDVQIVPVGVEYSQFTKMHQTVVQTYGKPIPLKKYWSDFRSNAGQTLITVRDEVYDALQKLVIHIPSQTNYHAVESLRIITRPWLYTYLGLKKPDAHQKMAAEQHLIEAQTAFEAACPEAMNHFARSIENYCQRLKQLNFRPYLIHDPLSYRRTLLGEFLMLIPFFPLYALGVITGYLPYKIPVWFSKRTFKDFMYLPAVNMTGGMFLFPLFWLLETSLVQLIGQQAGLSLAFAILMPVSCWVAFRYWIQLKKFWHKWRFIRFAEKKPDILNGLRRQHAQILKTTEELLEEYGGDFFLHN